MKEEAAMPRAIVIGGTAGIGQAIIKGLIDAGHTVHFTYNSNADSAEAIRRELPAVTAVAPTAAQTMTAIYGNENWTTSVTAASEDYLAARQWRLGAGRTFTPSEQRSGASVCVIGQTVRQKLFGSQGALGETIRLQKLACSVIGLLEPKGQAAMGMDQDDIVLIPLRTFQRRVAGNTDVRSILVSVRDGGSTERVRFANTWAPSSASQSSPARGATQL